MPRRERPRSAEDPALEQRDERRERRLRPRREDALVRELVDFETAGEPHSGEGIDESGTLPGSVGGTTGESKRAAGQQAPGATAPPIPGVDPEQARRLVGRRRRVKELEAEGEETDDAK